MIFHAQVSLNEGCHQLRFYHGVPDGSVPFSESCQVGKRLIPGASLLVRLVKNHVGGKGCMLNVSVLQSCICFFAFFHHIFILLTTDE